MKKYTNFLGTVWIGISTHKLRSFLTMLGIVIGVASVITLMSIGKGATATILESIESIGSDLITISPGSFTFQGFTENWGFQIESKRSIERWRWGYFLQSELNHICI